MDVINMIIPGFLVVISMVFITPCLTGEISRNDDDALGTYIHELMHKLVKEIQLKHDADISNLKDKFEDEISKLKLEMVRKDELYKSKFTKIEAEVKYLKKSVKSFEMPIQDKHMTVEENGEANLKSEIAGDDTPSNKTIMTKTTEKLSIATYPSTRRTKQEVTNKDDARHRRAYSESRIAFFATMTKKIEHMGVNQDIVFDNAVTNIGNAYIPHHGIFVAPVSGTYLFSTTLLSDAAHQQWAYFVVNGHNVAILYLSSNKHQSSHTIVVNLEQGHDVSIQSTSQDSSIYGDRHSSFSGVLLYESGISSSFVG